MSRESFVFVAHANVCRPVWMIAQSCLLVAAGLLSACTGGVTASDVKITQGSTYFSVGGTVSGLTGAGLVVQNNNGDSLKVSGNGSFTFKTTLTQGNSYNVSVASQPLNPSQTCTVSGGSGTIAETNVDTVQVTCADKAVATDAISVTVSGLAGSGLVLQNDGADNLAIIANGIATFANRLPTATPYAVTVLTPPMFPYQDCTVVNGVGVTGQSDINNVQVTCKTNNNPTYTIGGTISGISNSAPIVLQDNGTDNLPLTKDGTFTFNTSIPSGSAYSVTALSSAGVTRACAFTNASGVVNNTNVSNVSVVCTATSPIVNISASVTGLTGTLILQNNGGDNLTVSANGLYTFPIGVTSGGTYAVTVATQPVGEICTVTSGSGTATPATRPIAINCSANSYSVTVVVAGLNAGQQLTLSDNGADSLQITGNGSYQFAAPIAFNGTYAVAITSPPVGSTCTVTGGSGSGVVANVTVLVNCATITFPVTVTVTGLRQGVQVTFLDNGANPLVVSANGTFTFGTRVAYGGGYAVTVSTQPLGEICTVAAGSGIGVTTAVAVSANCASTTFPISAAVTGLSANKQVTLQDNGADALTFTTNITQAFATPIAYGGSYAVTVSTQPVGETCTPSNGSGTNVTAAVAVTVTCTQITYPVSVTVTGLSSPTQLVLLDNGTGPLIFTTNGTQTFTTQIPYGGGYAVTVGAQPPNQLCTVTGGSGTGVTAAISVSVSCRSNLYVEGNVSGYSSSGLQLTSVTQEVTQAQSRTAFASYEFGGFSPGDTYDIEIYSQPLGFSQLCSMANNHTGTVGSTNVTNVNVTCNFAVPNVGFELGSALGASGPLDAVYDNAGNLFYTDYVNNEVLMIPAGTSTATVIAGIGTAGSADGDGTTTAQFNGPTGIAIDANNNLFVADRLNNEIREIQVTSTSPNGVPVFSVTTILGSTTAGSADGAGSTARFYGPTGIAVDSSGGLIIADQRNNLIRRAYNDGGFYAYTIAGNLNGGSTDGYGSNASFFHPASVSVAAPNAVILAGGGNGANAIFIADAGNNEIRVLLPATVNGVATYRSSTLAGTTTPGFTDNAAMGFARPLAVVLPPAAAFNNPAGVVARESCPDGTTASCAYSIYVADVLNNAVRAVSVADAEVNVSGNGIVSTLAGGGSNGVSGDVDATGSNARFFEPFAVSLDSSGNVVVADYLNTALRAVTPSGVVSTLYSGSTGSANGTATAARFNHPSGVAFDAAGTTLYIADQWNNMIRSYYTGATAQPVPTSSRTLAGNPTSGSADGTGGAAGFYHPAALATDSAGNVYVADTGNNEIRMVTSAGVVTTLAGSTTPGSADGQGSNAGFNQPQGIVVDAAGNIYVADTGNNEIRMIVISNSVATVTTIAGVTGAGFINATGTAARFNAPAGLAIDAIAGLMYVADSGNNAIRAISLGGSTPLVVTTVAGGTSGSVDGTGAAAQFNSPLGVSVDPVGNIYVADTGNDEIREITTGAVVTTLVGTAGTAGHAGGLGTGTFDGPIGVAADPFGDLYVGDSNNNQIRGITPTISL